MDKQSLQTGALISLLFISMLSFTCCDKEPLTVADNTTDNADTNDDSSPSDAASFNPTDWTTETHSKEADPNFEEVFDDTAVKRLDLVISAENWEAMLADMGSIYGQFGSNAGGSGGPGGPGAPGGGGFSDQDPIFVPASLFYKDKEWYKVGIRFKGNSSLQKSWSSGILKLSFKLDFDEYEDSYPQIDNQRFYGFKKLSLKNNFDDRSFIREKVTADIFKNAGLAVSHTAFYTLYVDHGEGPQYFGLYTLVEEVDNTLIDTQFSSDDGNLYKPENEGANFVEGSFNERGFEKKTNEDAADWSDIQALFSALHDDSRTTDSAAWRAQLESVFAVDVFLHYLAVNTLVQNWDTYGRMLHNYYLYNNPDNQLLTWIPWDNNEALQEGKMGGALNLDFSNLSLGEWPLIEYLYNDPVYRATYDTYVQEILDGAFETSHIQGVYEQYAALIEPYATSEIQGYTFLDNSSEFSAAIAELTSHAATRAAAAENYLD